MDQHPPSTKPTLIEPSLDSLDLHIIGSPPEYSRHTKPLPLQVLHSPQHHQGDEVLLVAPPPQLAEGNPKLPCAVMEGWGGGLGEGHDMEHGPGLGTGHVPDL